MKLIAMDLDGTLLGTDMEVSLESKNYLSQLKEEGNIIVIATGRNFESAFSVTKGASFANYIVSNAGAAIFDNMNKKLLLIATIPYKIAQSVLELYHTNIEFIEFLDLLHHNKFSINESDNIPLKLKEIYDFLDNKNNILQICISFRNDSTATEVCDYISKKYQDLNAYTVHCAYDKKVYIDILKKDISKYTAINEIAKIHNIKNEDIIAFGDSENDLEMIKNSGVSIAMGNAFDIVKQNAKYVTSSNDENGIVEFLRLYL